MLYPHLPIVLSSLPLATVKMYSSNSSSKPDSFGFDIGLEIRFYGKTSLRLWPFQPTFYRVVPMFPLLGRCMENGRRFPLDSDLCIFWIMICITWCFVFSG